MIIVVLVQKIKIKTNSIEAKVVKKNKIKLMAFQRSVQQVP